MLGIKPYVLTNCCEQFHDAISHYSASLEQHLRSKMDARCKTDPCASKCVCVCFTELNSPALPSGLASRRKPRAGAGTVAAGCRMDRESLGFIWSNSASKDCAVPCSSIIDALKRKNKLLIKQTQLQFTTAIVKVRNTC